MVGSVALAHAVEERVLVAGVPENPVVTARMTGKKMVLHFKRNQAELTGQADESGVFRFKGSKLRYEVAPLADGQYQLLEYVLPGDQKRWEVVLTPRAGKIAAPAPPKPSLPVAKESPAEQLLAGGDGKVRAWLSEQGMRLRFASSGRELTAPRREDGSFHFQGKNYRYTAQPENGGWLLTEYGLEGQATGWRADLRAGGEKRVLTTPPPALLSAVTEETGLPDQPLFGVAANGTRVETRVAAGQMALVFPTQRIRLPGERLADGVVRFQGRRFVYQATPRADGGMLLTEYDLTGEKRTGWTVRLGKASPPPAHAAVATPFGERVAVATNGYFSDKLLHMDGYLQPNAIINVLPALRGGELGYFVLDLVLSKGVHHFMVALEAREGSPGDMEFEPVDASEDGFVYTAVGVVAGPLPPGWINFRVMDRVDGRGTTEVGLFRILARELPQSSPPLENLSGDGNP